jgi:hypothetical protein
MVKRIFRPFWSYDVIRTENWLKAMSRMGCHLVKLNAAARLFTFEEGEPKTFTYHLCFHKKPDLPAADNRLAGNGWPCVFAAGGYLICRTADDAPAGAGDYAGFLKKNRRVQRAAGVALLCLICLCPAILYPLPFILIFGFINVPLIVLLCAGLLALCWLICTYFKLRGTNKALEPLCRVKTNIYFKATRIDFLSENEETILLNNKQLVQRSKLYWRYFPCKTEQWLEKMEAEGFHLYRMGGLGIRFYFYKGCAEKTKFVVDYKTIADDRYFSQAEDNGWRLIFKPVTGFMAITVWAHRYNAGGPEPQFYSDPGGKIKQAKKYAVAMSICFIPIFLIFIATIIIDIASWLITGHPNFFLMFIQSLVIVEFGARPNLPVT